MGDIWMYTQYYCRLPQHSAYIHLLQQFPLYINILLYTTVYYCLLLFTLVGKALAKKRSKMGWPKGGQHGRAEKGLNTYSRKKGADLAGPSSLRKKNCLVVVGLFAVVGEVKALFLFFIARADADRELQDQQDQEGYASRPDQRDADVPELRNDLRHGVKVTHLVGNVVVDAGAAERRINESACAQRADRPADAVHAEGIEGIVVAQPDRKSTRLNSSHLVIS